MNLELFMPMPSDGAGKLSLLAACNEVERIYVWCVKGTSHGELPSKVFALETDSLTGSALFADADTVYKQLNLGLIGVNRYLCHVLDSVDISLTAEMDERLVREPSLVCIEGILLVFSVHRDKTLMVLSVFTTL